jgi:gamma-glutamylcyclotransferase (GGCT)/AIG2-like uncharacterized protein YtfP
MYYFDFKTYYPKIENKKYTFVSKGVTTIELYVSNTYNLLSFYKFYPEQTPTKIIGYIYEINDQILKELDDMNNYPYLSDKKLINVILEGNDEFELSVEAYCYFNI